MTAAVADGARLMREAAELLGKVHGAIGRVAWKDPGAYDDWLEEYDEATKLMAARLVDMAPALFEAAGEPEEAAKA